MLTNRRPVLLAAGIVTFGVAIVAVAMWIAMLAPTMDTLLSVEQLNRLVRARQALTPFLFILPPCGVLLIYRAWRGSRILTASLIPVAWLAGFVLFTVGEQRWIGLALALTR